VSAEAGWYDDPAAGDQRYWDGDAWTDQRREVSPSPSPSPSPPPSPPPPPPTPQAPSSKGRWPLFVGAVAVVVLIAAGILVASLVQSATKSTNTFAVNGSLELSDTSGDNGDGTCTGSGGYDDISPGAQVTIKDSAGKVVAVGSLGDGVSSGGACTFNFTVSDVPGGSKIYAVEVSHRGDINFTRSEAEDVSLTLG
jgi:hypothetical protein